MEAVGRLIPAFRAAAHADPQAEAGPVIRMGRPEPRGSPDAHIGLSLGRIPTKWKPVRRRDARRDDGLEPSGPEAGRGADPALPAERGTFRRISR